MSSPERSRNGSAGCRIAGSARMYPACANDNSRASAHAADPVARGAAVRVISTSKYPEKRVLAHDPPKCERFGEKIMRSFNSLERDRTQNRTPLLLIAL